MLHNADNASVAALVASFPRARFIAATYTKVGKLQGRGPERRYRGRDRVRWSLITGFDYIALCERSRAACAEIDPASLVCGAVDLASAQEAWCEVMTSLELSAAGQNSSTTDDAFEPLRVDGRTVPGGRVHVESGIVYLQALRIHEVIEERDVEQPLPVNSAPKTIAKARLRSRLPIGRYVSLRLKPEQAPRFSYTQEVAS